MGNRQETEFTRNEGDAWFERNKDKLYLDYIGTAIIDSHIDIKHADILEIGSGRGECISRLQYRTDGVCIGIDPSNEATEVSKAKFPHTLFMRGTATSLPRHETFDLIIYGFCLYLCDREDLLEIAARGDAALNDGGHILIHDFDPEHPYCMPYKHRSGLFSYKQDYSKLWLGSPTYSMVHKTLYTDDETAVWILKKDINAGWPLETLK